jgi:truncated hemoglobin YjbI
MTEHSGRVHLSAESSDLVLAEQDDESLAADVAGWYRGLGGDEFADRLAAEFYRLVADDELLSPLFDGSWQAHAKRLATHFRRMYGKQNLSQAWSPGLLAAHTRVLISHDHRTRWIALFRKAGAALDAPEPQFSELVAVMLIAAGDMMAASRGAALQRGERFDSHGRPR